MDENKLMFEATLPIDTLIVRIREQLSLEGVFEFVKALDLAMADYDLTKNLRDHFVSEMEKESKHDLEED